MFINSVFFINVNFLEQRTSVKLIKLLLLVTSHYQNFHNIVQKNYFMISTNIISYKATVT